MYEFKEPSKEEGYKKLKIPTNIHNKLIPNKQQGKIIEVVYFYNRDKMLIIRFYTKTWGKILLTMLGTVPSIFMYGVPETYKELVDLWKEKKKGKFLEERVFFVGVENIDYIKHIIKNVDKLAKKYEVKR